MYLFKGLWWSMSTRQLIKIIARNRRRRKMIRQCFHHDPGSPQNWTIGDGRIVEGKRPESWIKSELINSSKAEMSWCTRCGRSWF